MHRCLLISCVLGLTGFLAGQERSLPSQEKPAPARGKQTIEYSRDIQPILSVNCFTCHGPDGGSRKAGLRLDLAEEATRTLRSGLRALVPGDLKASELIARIDSHEISERMPPAKSQKVLKDREKELLKRWIAEGAVYQKHWAFEQPRVLATPPPKLTGWTRNRIDELVLLRLEEEGLTPAPEADRYTLARRAALDLTGLPPSLEAVDRFVADKSPDAYEKFVDQLLQSSAYGERWAQVWLDLARYADSNGYAEDQPRTIWKYRDWVIQAINKNQPFDRFTVEQIAGDMMPNPTPDQLIATAFHRNTLTNTEGGTNDEEFRNIAVVDRVNTTLQVWMGLTAACAQCHDHKYDPISQEEYFQLFAIFNQSEDSDKADNSPNYTYPTAEEAKKKSTLEAQIALLEKEIAGLHPNLADDQKKWEKEVNRDKLAANIKAILMVEPAKRKPAQKQTLTSFYRSTLPDVAPLEAKIQQAQAQIVQVQPVPTPIMRELPAGKQRVTKIHVRGDWLNLGTVVKPGVPKHFHPLPKDMPANRLALAQWLIDPKNTLTGRVTVNRYWEQIFGVGLVETPEDFGMRSKFPTHSTLLDWLAVEFTTTMKWDVKQLLKIMVTSATYRQSSKVTPELLQRDPDNRLFSRGPRFRSTAETVRDQALHVSGLLSPKMYGPSVRPPQPKIGLTAAFGPGTDWANSTGEDKYRRALYTYWRRTTPYPSMQTFDAPSRNVCSVTRPRTNTPLQALVTLNDPVYVEAAQALARRLVKDGGDTTAARATFAFRLCLTRPPSEVELGRLVKLYEKARTEYAQKPKEASAMAADPLGPVPAGMNAVELAAWTVVGNVLLNLDETLAKR
jgi:mono/diheme cytochrome c family protein